MTLQQLITSVQQQGCRNFDRVELRMADDLPVTGVKVVKARQCMGRPAAGNQLVGYLSDAEEYDTDGEGPA